MKLKQIFLVNAVTLVLLTGALQAQDGLSLQDVFKQAISNNPKLEQLKKQIQKTVLASDAPLAALDPSLSLSAGYSFDNRASYLSIFGGETNGLGLSAAYSQLTDSGWQVGAALSSNWVHTPASAFVPVNPYYNSVLSLSVSKALQRGKDNIEIQQSLALAKAQADLAKNGFQTLSEGILYQGGLSFWNWVRANEVRRLKDESLALAQELAGIVDSKSRRGLSEKRDVLQTQSLVLLRKQELLSAQQDVDAAWAALQGVLYGQPTASYAPQYTFQTVLDFPSIDELIKNATQKRQDRQQIVMQQALTELQLALYAEQQEGSLAVNAKAETSGLKSDPLSSLANLLTVNNPHYEVGLSYAPALARRSEKLAYDQSLAERERLAQSLRAFDLELAYALQKQYQLVLGNGKKADTAKALVDAQKAKMDNETENYKVGRSVINYVIDSRNDYVNAQLMQLNAQVERELSYLNLLYLQHKLWGTFVSGKA